VHELRQEFNIENQKALGKKVMQHLGFDFDHGRLDISHHPFCSGVPEDVRITTRYDTSDFSSSLMAVIHETGHAMYEQGLPPKWRAQPVGKALSSGTHESQSLLMEMQASRSLEFFHFAAPLIQTSFLGKETNDPAWNANNLHRLCSRVKKSFIRVDADEVTYPLHVMLRYEIEKMLIAGDLEVASIPDIWDDKMQTYLSLPTKGNFANGCMQDVHWPAGLFGYFPTYTLGAMTAAQLYAAAQTKITNLSANLSDGNFKPLLTWLREHVHSQGKFKSFDDLMITATGHKLNAKFFKQHLSDRYL
jgi:carboxypeptidase Taq